MVDFLLRAIRLTRNYESDLVLFEPVSLALDQSGTLASPRTGHCLTRRGEHGGYILPVHCNGVHSISVGTSSDFRLRVTDGHGSGDRVTVVFTEVNDGKLPEGGHVERFVERTLIDRAVPEEAQTYLVGATNFGTQADAGSERDAAADNGRLADESNAVVRQVHGAAAVLADARCFAHQLGHQRPQISAFANGVTVRAG